MLLFREEVLSERAGQWLGSVRLAQSVPAWLSSGIIAIALAFGLVAYGVFGSYARKAYVSVMLAPKGGKVNIEAPAAGRVAQLRFRKGQAVAAGEVLMALDTDRAALVTGSVDGVGNTAALAAKQIELRHLGIQAERSTCGTQVLVRSRAFQDRLLSLNAELADEIAQQARRRDVAQREALRRTGGFGIVPSCRATNT